MSEKIMCLRSPGKQICCQYCSFVDLYGCRFSLSSQSRSGHSAVVFSFVDLPSALVMLNGKTGPFFLPINLYLSIFIYLCITWSRGQFEYIFTFAKSSVVLCGM